MKKVLSVIAVLWMFSLAACSSQGMPDAAVDRAGSAPSGNIVMVDEGGWPENEYTEGLPIPPGTVSWAVLDAEHGNCGVGVTDISETEFNDYMALLKQEGFSVIEEVSEEIQGQDAVSIGTLLSNDEKGLSISYASGNFSMYISFAA